MFDVPGFEGEQPLFPFILKVLAGKDRKMIGKHLLYRLYFDSQIQSPEMESRWAAARRPEYLEHAVIAMIETMRRAADLWIDSGKNPTEPRIDSPTDRNVEVTLPGQSVSLFRWMFGALFSHLPRYTEMFRDGTQRVARNWPRISEEKFKLRGVSGALRDYGQEFALYYFAELLDSPDSRRIARCDHCRGYFPYERARLRTVKNGVFCPSCKGKASVSRTRISRFRRIDTAARAQIEWESRHKGPVQPEWVANQVNKAHGTAFGRRWVSQHLKEIQERVEAQPNAKS
jgi:hypothetical protein